jgi:hypothetical protein
MPARSSQVRAADEGLQIIEIRSHAFVRLRARRLHASIAALKGSGETGGAAGISPRPFSEIALKSGAAGMGKIERSYSRFDEPLEEPRDAPTSASLEVIVGLIAVFIALGLVGLLLAFPPG